VALNRQMVFQVTMPALLVALAMLGTSLLGIRSINQLQADRDKIILEHGRSLQDAQDLETNLRRLRLHSFLYVMDMSADRWSRVEHDQEEFEKALERVRQQETSPEKQQVIEAIEAGYVEYREELQRSTHSPVGPEIMEYLRWADSHPIRFVVEPCEQLLEINRREMNDTAEESGRQSARARSRMIWLAVVGAGGGLVGGFGVAWGLSRSITRLSVRLQDVHAHLDREVGSLRLRAEDPNLQKIERQVGAILERVRDVVGQLQRQEREGLRAEQLAAVGQLAAGMAHEVRNPLTSIKLLVGAAMNGKCGKGLSEADLQVIHDEVGRLERKVQALLDFARPIETGHQPENVADIIHRVIDLVQERLRQQSVNVNLDLANRPLHADLDRDQFQSVLVNLIFNALDAMPRGGRIDICLEESPRGQIRLQIADTGPGVDAAIADRLFTPFVSTKPTGTGLGLSLSRRIVEAHGGNLSACNRDAGGACFSIQLPLAAGDVSRADIARRG
jgi:two-component system, NtrC family, sensor histidine kinase HydH